MQARSSRTRSIQCRSTRRRAENRSKMRPRASTPKEMMRRTLTGAVLPLLATTLLLALPPAAMAQVQRVLVIYYTAPAPPLTLLEDGGDAACTTTVTYNVRLSTRPSSDVTVTVVSGDTDIATVGDTDTGTPGNENTLTFIPDEWNNNKPVQLACVGDKVANAGGERSVTITNTPSGGGFQTAKEVQLTVYDDNDDTAGLTVTNAAGDTVTEGNSVATVNERGDRRPETGTGREADYTVKLDSEPTGNVVVAVASSDTKIATVSPASLTFTPTNYPKGQTVTVTGVDDITSSAEREATITHTPGGGGYGPAQTKSVKVTVNNGGTTTPETAGLKFSLDTVVVDEGRKATYSVRLTTRPDSTANVILSTGSTEHVSVNPSSLEFTRTNYNVAQTVTVTSFNDDAVDNDPESPPDDYAAYRDTVITHTVRGGGSDYDGTVTGTVTARLQDDDTAAVLLDKTALRVRDNGGTEVYRVRLKTQPLANNVTVTVTSADPTAATVSPAVLTFTSTDWSKTQTVTVTGVADRVDNPGPNRMAEITHTVGGGSAGPPADGYARSGDDAPDAPPVTVTIVDNDVAGLKISKTTTTITEAGPAKTYMVELESDAAVTVTITSSDPGGHCYYTKPVDFHKRPNRRLGRTEARYHFRPGQRGVQRTSNGNHYAHVYDYGWGYGLCSRRSVARDHQRPTRAAVILLCHPRYRYPSPQIKPPTG